MARHPERSVKERRGPEEFISPFLSGSEYRLYTSWARDPAPEKEKVSLTLDANLVAAIRERLEGRPLSTSVNDLLYAALAQRRLAELVQEMIEEGGPPSRESYERVMGLWLEND